MARISSKLVNVVVNPFQGLPLIFQSVVETVDLTTCEEAIWTDAIVESNHDDVVARGRDQSTAIILSVGIVVEATTLDEKVHRQL